jgi:hypothetical protein
MQPNSNPYRFGEKEVRLSLLEKGGSLMVQLFDALDRCLVCHLIVPRSPCGRARLRSVHRKKSGHDIIATKTAAQKASTAQFE